MQQLCLKVSCSHYTAAYANALYLEHPLPYEAAIAGNHSETFGCYSLRFSFEILHCAASERLVLFCRFTALGPLRKHKEDEEA